MVDGYWKDYNRYMYKALAKSKTAFSHYLRGEYDMDRLKFVLDTHLKNAGKGYRDGGPRVRAKRKEIISKTYSYAIKLLNGEPDGAYISWEAGFIFWTSDGRVAYK